MTKKYYRLWSVVRKVILEHYDVLKNEFLRDAYYLIRDLTAPLIGSSLTQEDYNWLLTRQGYASLRDDVWPSLEQKEGLERPKAWPVGVVFDQGLEKPLSELERNMELGLDYVWDQARGFIFIEKRGEAIKLKLLSEFGWTIAAGPGYPERLIRKLLKEEKEQRPVLALHDFDRDGRGIYRALGFATRRTKHLDIALGDRVTDLGLSQEHVKMLNLPMEPSPPKYKGELRVELSGLSVLKLRMGLENPMLAYTVAAMFANGLTLSPTELSKKVLSEKHLRWLLTEGLSPVIDAAIEWIIKQTKLEGSAVEAVLVKKMYTVPGLREKLIEVGMQFMEKIEWRKEDYFHSKAQEFTDEKLVELLRT